MVVALDLGGGGVPGRVGGNRGDDVGPHTEEDLGGVGLGIERCLGLVDEDGDQLVIESRPGDRDQPGGRPRPPRRPGDELVEVVIDVVLNRPVIDLLLPVPDGVVIVGADGGVRASDGSEPVEIVISVSGGSVLIKCEIEKLS